MTETQKTTRTLRPASMFRLTMGRPRLPLRASKILGWIAFIFLALLPLCVVAAIVFYLTSSRWPADFSKRLSNATGLQVNVGRVTGVAQNRMQLHDITISGRNGGPVIIQATAGDYDTGEAPTISLYNVQLYVDIDWWTDPKGTPEPDLFVLSPSGTRPPVMYLSTVTVNFTSAGTKIGTLGADLGWASLTNGVANLKLATKVKPTTSVVGPHGPVEPLIRTSREVMSASLGYQHGTFVKRLMIGDAGTDLLKGLMAKGLGQQWADGFEQISGNLTMQHPVDGASWVLDGKGTFKPTQLTEVTGLSKMGGRFDVTLEHISGNDNAIVRGKFRIALVKTPYSPPDCVTQTLRVLQVMTTGKESVMATGMSQFPFDSAQADVTIDKQKIYIEAMGKENAAMASGSMPILSFPPQTITRQEWTERLQNLVKSEAPKKE